MTTYVQKRTRAFLDRGDIKPERRRSESRLKTYPSAIDIRAWCDIVEDRRQHILELITKGKNKCFGQLVPIEAIINALLAGKIADITKLRKCLTQLWKFIDSASLCDADRNKLVTIKQKMDPICIDRRFDKNQVLRKESDECVAKARHEREQAEIDALLKGGGTYKVTTRGPARITTRIKGIRPGFQVVPGGASGSITTRAQGPTKVKTIAKNVFPNLKDKESANQNTPQQQSESYHQGQYQEQSIAQKTQPRPEQPQIQKTQSRNKKSRSHQGLPQEPSARQIPTKESREVSKPLQPGQSQIQKTQSQDKKSREVSQNKQAQEELAQIQANSLQPGQSQIQKIQSSQSQDQKSRQELPPERSTGKIPKENSFPCRQAEELPQGQITRSSPGLPQESSHQKQIQIAKSGDSSRQIQPSVKSISQANSERVVEFTPIFSTFEDEVGDEESSMKNQTDFKIQLEARDTLCNELQTALENMKNERDDFRTKLETTLEELESVKKLNAANPVMPKTCKEEIEALELEIKVMRSGNLSPEQEAEFIRKEVEVLKKYCMKLKSVEDENENLKLERDTLKSQVTISVEAGHEKQKSTKDNLNRQVAGILEDTEKRKSGIETIDNDDVSKTDIGSKENLANIEELKNKLKNLDDITKERDMLANKVQRLEKELLQYRDLPEDIDVYRNRSKMLDSALEERDRMSKKVEQIKSIEDELNQLRKKSSRVDQLEEELKLFSKNDKNIGSELKKSNSRCICLEKELENVKMERNSMCTRIEYMKKEIDTLRAKSKEAEIYKLERDRLQIKLNELSQIQAEYENLRLKCKCLENMASEKEIYKQKYEEVLAMESQGDALRSQVEHVRCLQREKTALVKQVSDLESCICDQEEEIKKLVTQIDTLCRCKDDNQCRMKEALASMRAEIEKKDCLIAESEEKLASVQAQLKSSIQGVSCETTCYKTRIEDLEREVKQSQSHIDMLQKQIKDKDVCLKGIEKLSNSEYACVAAIKRELDAAKEENKKLREIANKMVALTGDEHVKNMLRQSQCAVKRVVEELGRQYKEWDNMKRNQKKGIYAQVNKQCPCKYKHINAHHMPETESNEKLLEELEDIHREKEKLEQLVKQIQNDKVSDGPQGELISLRIDYAKVQEQLEKEMKQRKQLEKKLKTV